MNTELKVVTEEFYKCIAGRKKINPHERTVDVGNYEAIPSVAINKFSLPGV